MSEATTTPFGAPCRAYLPFDRLRANGWEITAFYKRASQYALIVC
jgi:hypothetical protein